MVSVMAPSPCWDEGGDTWLVAPPPFRATDTGGRCSSIRRMSATGSPGRCRQGNAPPVQPSRHLTRSEEHTSELQSLMRISYAVFCLKKKKTPQQKTK